MTDEQLIDAVAAALRAYSTTPLGDCEIHAEDQLAYEGTSGALRITMEEVEQAHIAIGDQPQSMMDHVPLLLEAWIEHADTATNRSKIHLLCRQMLSCLRSNRQITAGGELATSNARESIRYQVGHDSEGTHRQRWCKVLVIYDKTPPAIE